MESSLWDSQKVAAVSEWWWPLNSLILSLIFHSFLQLWDFRRKSLKRLPLNSGSTVAKISAIQSHLSKIQNISLFAGDIYDC